MKATSFPSLSSGRLRWSRAQRQATDAVSGGLMRSLVDAVRAQQAAVSVNARRFQRSEPACRKLRFRIRRAE